MEPGTDRTYFFADYEGNRRRFTTRLVLNVPTEAMRSRNLNNLPGPAAVGPSTGLPFENNQIPSSEQSTLALSLLKNYVPLPNASNIVDLTGNYRVQAPTPANINGYDVRIDRTINDKQQLYGRWSWKNVDSDVHKQPAADGVAPRVESEPHPFAQLYDSSDAAERGARAVAV